MAFIIIIIIILIMVKGAIFHGKGRNG